MIYNYICVKQELHHKDIGNYTSYGIALNDSENILLHDVCCEKERIEALISVLNELQIESPQVKYLVEDLIYSR